MAKKEKLFIILLIGFGFFLRVWHLSELMGFDYDQEVAMEAVERILSGKLILIGQQTSTGVFIGPGYYYLLALFYWLFGKDPIGWGVMVALISVVTMMVLFSLTRALFDKTTAFLALSIYATNARINFYDRTTAPSNLVMLTSLLTMFIIWEIRSGKKWLLPVLAFILTAAMIHIHPSVVTLLPLTIILWIHWAVPKPTLKQLIVSLGMGLLTASPLIVFDLRHNLLNVKGVQQILGNQGDEAYVWIIKTLITFRTQVENLTSLFALGKIGLIPVLGTITYWIKDRSKAKTILFYWIVIPAITLGFYSRHIPEYYLLSSFAGLIILIAFIARKIMKSRLFVGVIFIITIICVNLLAIFHAKNPYSYKSKVQTVQYIKQEEGKGATVTFDTDAGLQSGFRYLLHNEGVISNDTNQTIFTIVMPADRRSAPGKEKIFGGIKVIESQREM